MLTNQILRFKKQNFPSSFLLYVECKTRISSQSSFWRGSKTKFLWNIPVANSARLTIAAKDSNERKLLFWRLLPFAHSSVRLGQWHATRRGVRGQLCQTFIQIGTLAFFALLLLWIVGFQTLWFTVGCFRLFCLGWTAATCSMTIATLWRTRVDLWVRVANILTLLIIKDQYFDSSDYQRPLMEKAARNWLFTQHWILMATTMICTVGGEGVEDKEVSEWGGTSRPAGYGWQGGFQIRFQRTR